MLIKKSLLIIALAAMFVTGLFAGKILKIMGNTDSTSTPGSTNSFTLKDIYERLDNGAAGAQSTFTEPTDPPGTGTMHTLNEIMTKAPASDNTDGATKSEVLTNKTFWGLNATAGEWGLQTGTRHPAPVQATGQTICYTEIGIVDGSCTSPAGQDGSLQRGVPWPNPRFVLQPGGRVVTDNLTGLMWLKDANVIATIGGWDPDGPDDGAVIWLNTFNAIAQLNAGAGGFAGRNGGYSDWRLPNRFELESLLNLEGGGSPTLPAGYAAFFSNVQSATYWTGTSYDPPPYPVSGPFPEAWTVDFQDGSVPHRDKATGYCFVWTVRGGYK